MEDTLHGKKSDQLKILEMLDDKDLNTIYKFNIINQNGFFNENSGKTFFLKSNNFIISSNQPYIKDIWNLLKIFKKICFRANLFFCINSNNFSLIKNFFLKLESKFPNLKIILIPENIVKKSLHENNTLHLERVIYKFDPEKKFSYDFIYILKKYLRNKLFLLTNLVNYKEINNNKFKNQSRNLGVIVHARMSSTRLPGKAMLEINGEPVVYKILKRFSDYFGIEKTVLSTSTNLKDDILTSYIKSKGFEVFRGDEENLARRMIDVCLKKKFTHVVRVTGDDLFRDLQSIDNLYKNMIKYDLDYIYSDDLILGCNSEIFNLESLLFIDDFCNHPEQTNALSWFLDRKEIFKILEFNHNVSIRPCVSLMLDEKRDYISFLKLWKNNEDFLSSNWKYKNLLKKINQNLSIFSFHPSDVGLLKRDKIKFSFIFDF